MNPEFPIYIVSKGRWRLRLTSKAFERMRVPYFIIVEEQEYKNYSREIDKSRILVLDKSFQDDYDTFDNLGNAKGKGPGPARNFAWEHSVTLGYPWHWVVDDNITVFLRVNRNRIVRVGDGAIFKVMEDFVLRYENVGMAGPNYEMFIPRRAVAPPLRFNTRIYSCNLIRNDVQFRWRGRYNEDTDLSLRMLKAGWCTILFNAFLQQKRATQRMLGGNTNEFYDQEGTLPKSKMLVAMHSDVTKLVWKFNRWHHEVNYKPFANNKLVRKEGVAIDKAVDNYGMKLTTKKPATPMKGRRIMDHQPKPARL